MPRSARAQGDGDADSSEVIAVGRIVHVSEFRGRVAVLSADLEDATGRLRATWFGRRGLTGKLAAGRAHLRARPRCTATLAQRHRVELNVLHHALLGEDETYRGTIVPVYPATKEVSSRALATTIERNFDALAALVSDTIPDDVLAAARLWSAARSVAQPAPARRRSEQAASARERVVFEEFFGIALGAALKRAQRRAAGGARPLSAPPALLERFEAAQPFALTAAQRRVIAELWARHGGTAPMNRLLQGDVGSGKTVVAAAAIVLAAHERRAKRADGTDGDSRRAACAQAGAAAVAFRRSRRCVVRRHGRARPQRDAGSARKRRVRSRGRNARADRRRRGVPRSGSCDHRRATSLRRGAARQAARQEPLAAHASYDGDADSAHAGADEICRPRRFGSRRTAAGAHADRNLRFAREPQTGRIRLRAQER